MPLDTYDQIHADSEGEYLDNGGAMSIERRDYYFARAMAALKVAEAQIAQYRAVFARPRLS